MHDLEAKKEALLKARTHAERATEKERLYISAEYAGFIENDPEKEISIYKQLLDKYPKEILAQWTLGFRYDQKGMFQEAMEEYEKTLELDPSYKWALNDMGMIYSGQGEYEQALEYFDKQVSLYPDDPNALNTRGATYVRMGRIDEAIADNKRALEIRPDFRYSLLFLPRVYALKENYAEAIYWTDQYITRSQHIVYKAEGYVRRGFFNFWLGRSKQSLHDFSWVVNVAKEGKLLEQEVKSQALDFQGFVYLGLAEFERSRKCFKSSDVLVKELFPEYVLYNTIVSNSLLGFVDLKQGQIDSAKSRLAEMESLLSEKKEFDYREEAIYILGLLQGEVFVAESSYDEAISLFKEMPGMHPSDMEYSNVLNHREILARAYQLNGDLENAISEYESLISVDWETGGYLLINPRNYYRLGRLYEQKGWVGKANESYEKFLRLWKDADPGHPEIEDTHKRLAVLKNQ
jgi:tetratricopeptide (TPR) repeat protein